MLRHLLISTLLFSLTLSGPVFAKKDAPPAMQMDIEQTVIKQPLAEDVTAEDAVDAMKSKAVELNMKMVAEQLLSTELKARGVKTGVLEIYQFCNPMDAHKMVQYNMIFTAYMPCRIALVEDKQGKLWVMMMNLDILINGVQLPPDIKAIADKVNGQLKQVINAAASGEF